MGVGLVTGSELRLLRHLKRGPLYIGAIELVLGVSPTRARVLVRSLNKRGYVEHDALAQVHTWKITREGEEIVEAMTP